MAKNYTSSAAEARLAKLQQDYQAAKAHIQTLGYVLPGSLQKRLYRCGKPNCRCKSGGPLHGPYYQWTRKIEGKTVNISLPVESAKLVKDWIENNRKLRKLVQQLEKTSLAALQTTANMKNT